MGTVSPLAGQDSAANVGLSSKEVHWPRVVGRLVDSTSEKPIVGATINMIGFDASAVSDSLGQFRLPRVPPGTHQLEIHHVAYGTRRIDVAVRADVTTRLNLQLDPRAVEVEPLKVQVEFRPEYLQRVGFYERMERGWGNFVDPERAEQILSPYLEGRRALKRAMGEFPMPTEVIRQRSGCGSEGWVIYVDRRPEQYFGVLAQLRGEEIGAVEVYPHGHGAPAWAMEPACGVVLIWTERWSEPG